MLKWNGIELKGVFGRAPNSSRSKKNSSAPIFTSRTPQLQELQIQKKHGAAPNSTKSTEWVRGCSAIVGFVIWRGVEENYPPLPSSTQHNDSFSFFFHPTPDGLEAHDSYGTPVSPVAAWTSARHGRDLASCTVVAVEMARPPHPPPPPPPTDHLPSSNPPSRTAPRGGLPRPATLGAAMGSSPSLGAAASLDAQTHGAGASLGGHGAANDHVLDGTGHGRQQGVPDVALSFLASQPSATSSAQPRKRAPSTTKRARDDEV